MTVSRLRSPLLIAITLYLLLAALSVAWLFASTGGRFLYPIDDTYITMAMAKNWALHGVMGVTRWEFSASSSCPFWMFLITVVYRVAGVNVWTPAALSLAAGAALLVTAGRILLRETGDARMTGWTLVTLCLLLPLAPLGLSGMEHTLHMALAVPFVWLGCRYLAEPEKRGFVSAALLAAVMVMVRFESLFVIAVFCGLALVRRRWLAAMAMGLAALLPVALFGWYSVSQGGEWLPNSVLIKGGTPRLTSAEGVVRFLGLRVAMLLALAPHVLVLLAGVTVMWKRAQSGFWEVRRLMLLVVGLSILLHLQFASVGWFFRYEAYLVALAVVALMVNRLDLALAGRFSKEALRVNSWRAAMAAVVVATLPLWFRAGLGLTAYPAAAYNVYEQQYQMAGFLHRYYDGSTVAANDIGAINYYNDLRCVDLYGLANREVFRLQRSRAYTSTAMEDVAQRAGVRIAMLYDTWYDGAAGPKVPVSWRRAGTWTIRDNAFVGGNTVTFYAVAAGERERLVQSLRAFGTELPKSVAQRVD